MSQKLTAQQTSAVDAINANLAALSVDNPTLSPALIILVLEALRAGGDKAFPQFAPVIDLLVAALEKQLGG